MVHKGLYKEAVVKAAVKFIEEKWYGNFSMRALADMLGIKTASLYNHVSSMEELYTEIGLYALRLQKQTQLDSIEGKEADEAVYALADSYRCFAMEHRELYKVIMEMPRVPNAFWSRRQPKSQTRSCRYFPVTIWMNRPECTSSVYYEASCTASSLKRSPAFSPIMTWMRMRAIASLSAVFWMGCTLTKKEGGWHGRGS